MLFLIPCVFFFAPFIFSTLHRLNFLLLISLCFLTTFISFFIDKGIIEFTWFTLNNQSFIITLNNDVLTQQLIFLVNIIGICVIFYSRIYIKKDTTRYYTYLSIFLGSMHGLLISNHLLLLFFFWELVGMSSFLLIGFYFENKDSVYGSSKALWINKIGDLGFLIGILALWSEYKSFDLHFLSEQNIIIGEKSWIIWLLILGAFAKSAQGPFMIWLPDAMAGPTPASALIHAATMVAAGIYLIFRIHFLLTPEIQLFLAYLGSITAVIGSLYALFQVRLKAILAGSTISQLGWMLSALGTAFPFAAIEHLWAHAFYKAGLFLAAGYIIHYQENKIYSDYDPQDIRLMGGFAQNHTKIYSLLILLFSALIGIPCTSAFLTKEAILAAHELYFTFYLLLFSSILTTLYSLKVLYSLKNHQNNEIVNRSQPFKWGMGLPIIILSLGSLFYTVSLNPIHLEKPQMPYVNFLTNILSIGAILLGILIFWKWKTQFLKLFSENAKEFWGLNSFYNLWISQNLISRIENLENSNQYIVSRFLNPLFLLGNFLKFIEEKILVRLIMFLKNLLVTGKWHGMPISIAQFFQWLDTYVWDFGIINISQGVIRIGKFQEAIRSNKIQNYVLYSLFMVIVCIFIYLFFFK